MIGSRFGNPLPTCSPVRGLRVGEWPVDIVCEPYRGGAEQVSGAAVRLAEDLVAGLLELAPGAVRVAALAPSGRPVARIAGQAETPFLSISHGRSLIGAAASIAGQVGIDIVDPADAGRALDVFFSPDELDLVPDDLGLLRALLWAAKEAAYKAARLDTEFRPRQVTIDSLAANGFTWVVRAPHARVEGAGRFTTVGRHVLAIAATAPAASRRAAVNRGGRREASACS